MQWDPRGQQHPERDRGNEDDARAERAEAIGQRSTDRGAHDAPGAAQRRSRAVERRPVTGDLKQSGDSDAHEHQTDADAQGRGTVDLSRA